MAAAKQQWLSPHQTNGSATYVAAPVDDPGTVSCSITADEQLLDEDQADGMEECFVEAVVP